MQAAGLKINGNLYPDWGSDIGYLKFWRSISDNLRSYIKNQTQCFSRHIRIRWSWSTFFNPRFGVLSRKLDRTLCFAFDVMVSKPWIRSLTLIPPRFSFTGLHVNTWRSDLCMQWKPLTFTQNLLFEQYLHDRNYFFWLMYCYKNLKMKIFVRVAFKIDKFARDILRGLVCEVRTFSLSIGLK